MDLKHYEFITGCSSLVGIHGRLFKATATKYFPFNEQRNFCSHDIMVGAGNFGRKLQAIISDTLSNIYYGLSEIMAIRNYIY